MYSHILVNNYLICIGGQAYSNVSNIRGGFSNYIMYFNISNYTWYMSKYKFSFGYHTISNNICIDNKNRLHIF